MGVHAPPGVVRSHIVSERQSVPAGKLALASHTAAPAPSAPLLASSISNDDVVPPSQATSARARAASENRA